MAPEPEGYVRLFLDEGAPDAEPAARRQRCRASRGDQVRRLLSLGTAPPAAAPDAGTAPARAGAAATSLSERELQVLRLLDSELTGPEIARELFVSHNTVRTHTKHIFTKLDVTNRRAAVRRARERGLL